MVLQQAHHVRGSQQPRTTMRNAEPMVATLYATRWDNQKSNDRLHVPTIINTAPPIQYAK